MKTLKQVADMLGVPKDKVKYRAKKLPDNCLEKVGNITYVTDSGIAELCKMFEGIFFGKKVEKIPELSDFPSGVSAVIDVLTAQIEVKDRQIEALSEALKSAQQTAAAAQALHAGTIQGHISEPVKRSFLDKILRRKP
jgi:hypothetical protein